IAWGGGGAGPAGGELGAELGEDLVGLEQRYSEEEEEELLQEARGGGGGGGGGERGRGGVDSIERDARGSAGHSRKQRQPLRLQDFYDEQAVFPESFWPQSEPAQSMTFNPRGRVNKPLTPPPTAQSINNQLLFQYPVSQSQPAPYFVGGPMGGGMDGMAGSETGQQQAPPPAPLTPASAPPTSSCSAGPSPSSQGSETSFDCTHCGKSLRSRKNYSKHIAQKAGQGGAPLGSWAQRGHSEVID
ncbi:hypothetical protein CRUP_001081, partial [Coryphaenoides rupestris]